jgi:hypothetical protein
MKASQLQKEMLAAIAESEYQPSRPTDFENLDWVWAEFIIKTQQDKGTFTSLVNAGLVQHNGHSDKKESCVRLTESGFEVYKSI